MAKDSKPKRGMSIGVDVDTVKTAARVAKKVFKRKKKSRDLSSPR